MSDALLEQMLWPIVRSAAELLVSEELSQVKQCAGCEWLFRVLRLKRRYEMGEQEGRHQPEYESVKNQVIEFLAAKRAIVLATSLDGRVTARTVSMASEGLDVYFMSWGHHRKCVQIRGNPRVALCRDNVQIEGRAEILGSPLEEANQRYAELLRRKYPDDHERFAGEPGMVIVRVVPSTIAVFGKGDEGLYLDCLDLERATVCRKGMTDR